MRQMVCVLLLKLIVITLNYIKTLHTKPIVLYRGYFLLHVTQLTHRVILFSSSCFFSGVQ